MADDTAVTGGGEALETPVEEISADAVLEPSIEELFIASAAAPDANHAQRRAFRGVSLVVAILLLIGGLAYKEFTSLTGASSPQRAVTNLMTSLAGGRVSTEALFMSLAAYLPPSELALFNTNDLVNDLQKRGSVQRRLLEDVTAVARHATIKVSDIDTTFEMIDTNLAKVTVTDFNLDVKWDAKRVKKDWRRLLRHVIESGDDYSGVVRPLAKDMSDNWIAASLLRSFAGWLGDRFADATCESPPGYTPMSWLTNQQLLSSQAIECLADVGPDWLDRHLHAAMVAIGFSFPTPLFGQAVGRSSGSGLLGRLAPETEPFVMAVKEGGRWYVSALMTLGEYASCAMVQDWTSHEHQCAPPTRELKTWAATVTTDDTTMTWLMNIRQPTPGPGATADTPSNAVQATLNAYAAVPPFDVRASEPWFRALSAVADTMPWAERRLFGTYPLLLSQASQYSAGKWLVGLTGSFNTAYRQGGKAVVYISSLSNGPRANWRVHDGMCLSSPVDGCLTSLFDPNTIKRHTHYSVDQLRFAQAGIAFQKAAPLDRVGLVALRSGSGWQFSPTASAWHMAGWLWSGAFAVLNQLAG